MKKRYFRRTRRLSPRTTLLVMGLGALFCIGLLLRMFFPGVLIAFSVPFSHVGTAFSSVSRSLVDGVSLKAERDRLLYEVETLRNERESLRALLLDAGMAEEEQGVLAGVIARPPMTPYEMLVIGGGERDGIVAGALVFARGAPIGRIERAYEKTSLVRLFSAPGEVSEAWVGEERLSLTLRGAGAGAFIAEASRDATIVPGDRVYLPGPGPRAIGVVRDIESDPASPSVIVHIAPLNSVFSTTLVRVMPLP